MDFSVAGFPPHSGLAHKPSFPLGQTHCNLALLLEPSGLVSDDPQGGPALPPAQPGRVRPNPTSELQTLPWLLHACHAGRKKLTCTCKITLSWIPGKGGDLALSLQDLCSHLSADTCLPAWVKEIHLGGSGAQVRLEVPTAASLAVQGVPAGARSDHQMLLQF